MAKESAKNDPARIAASSSVSRTLVRPAPSLVPRNTASGRTWLACTMGIRPKISAVTRPINTPEATVSGSTALGRWMKNAFSTSPLTEEADADARRRADYAAKHAKDRRLQPEQGIEVNATVAGGLEHGDLGLAPRSNTCIVLTMPMPPISSASRPTTCRK